MFKCKSCGTIDKFIIMLSPSYRGKGIISQSVNENEQIVINVDGYTFIPDLEFMNAHACCEFCGTIKNWEVFFVEE